MALDIKKSKVDNLIKNGSIIVSVLVTGPTSKNLLNTYVSNAPKIEDIENKYDNLLDEINYYGGGGGGGGGNINGNVLGV